MRELNIKPLARISGFADAEVEPVDFCIAPAQSGAKALKKANLSINDIDFFEFNEAFATTVLANMKLLNVAHEKINVNGGAIAMGHPLGATGAMLLGTLLDELERQDKTLGLVTLCIGGGMGIATIIERV